MNSLLGSAGWPTAVMSRKAALLVLCCLLQCDFAWCNTELLSTEPRSPSHNANPLDSRLGQDAVIAGQDQAAATGTLLAETSPGSPLDPSATPGHPRNLQTAAFTLRPDACEASWQKVGSMCYRYIPGSWTQTEAAQECRQADSLGISTLATASNDAQMSDIVTAVSIPTNAEAWSGARYHSPSQGESQP